MIATRKTKLDLALEALAKIDAAVKGANGSAPTFRAACTLVGYDFNFDEALAILLTHYNPRCSPPWSQSELAHKLKDAFRVVQPRSYSQTPTGDGAGEAAQKRKSWPVFRAPNKAELRQIGELRNLSAEGLTLAVERGVLWAAIHDGRPCWIVTDSRRLAAQARRLDGKPFDREGTPKALTLPGSFCGSPIGFDAVPSFSRILFCEGGPDLLAAFHFIGIENRAADCHAVAMLGASHNIGEHFAPAFAGKRIRFFPHLDAAGRNSVARWARTLKPHAAKMDALNFAPFRKVDGSPVNDLNDICFVDADDFETHRILWNLAP